jgi:glucokinase-like ROK family protein
MASNTAQTVRDLRKVNRHRLLELAYFNVPISRLELSQLSGLSPATVTNVIADLLAEGIINELGSQESQGGRPRTILNINPAFGYFIGIEVGETHIHVELLDLKLTKLGETHHDIAPDDNQPTAIVERIVSSVRTLLADTRIAPGKILGVGIGFPGIVDQRAGVSVFAPNWDWHNVPLLELLQTQLRMPIHLNNGAQAMALAEKWFGAAKGTENLAVLLIGSGVGSGIITRGQLYQGTSNSAGEWGHTCIEINGRACRCGSTGCLETYVGAPGIIHSLRELAPDSPLLNKGGQVEVLAAIKAAAQKGDPTAMQVLDQTAHYLGAGIGNIINLFNPQAIVIGGWCGLLLGDLLLDLVRPYVERYALRAAFSAAQIQLSTLRQDAVSIGAASLALEEFMKAQLA